MAVIESACLPYLAAYDLSDARHSQIHNCMDILSKSHPSDVIPDIDPSSNQLSHSSRAIETGPKEKKTCPA